MVDQMARKMNNCFYCLFVCLFVFQVAPLLLLTFNNKMIEFNFTGVSIFTNKENRSHLEIICVKFLDEAVI